MLFVYHENHNSFYERGVSYLMLDFEFYLDAGDSLSVWYHQPVYGIYERKIMNTQIDQLELNGLIIECEGLWTFFLLLVAKVH